MWDNHPFIVDQWDFLIVGLAVLVRMLFTMKYKAKELSAKNKPFELKKYFDFRHVFRWAGHFVTAFTLALFVPELFIQYLSPKYLPEWQDWSFTGDFIIGFLGYDLIKLAEDVSYPWIKKLMKLKAKE